jgi:peroxiredoxin
MNTYILSSVARIGLALIFVGAFAASGCSSRSSSSAPSEQSQALREVLQIKMPSANGRQMSISDQRGKIVMLHFMSSWCRECSVEAPSLRNLHNNFKGSQFEIVGIAVDDEPFQTQSFVSRLQFPFPVLMDVTGDIKDFFSIKQLPSTLFLDRQGTPIYFKDPSTGNVTAKLEGSRAWDTTQPVQMIAGLVENR